MELLYSGTLFLYRSCTVCLHDSLNVFFSPILLNSRTLRLIYENVTFVHQAAAAWTGTVPLAQSDPEIYNLIKLEQRRQVSEARTEAPGQWHNIDPSFSSISFIPFTLPALLKLPFELADIQLVNNPP